MNVMKLLQLTVVFALVGGVFSSDLLDVTENDALHRYKRAWKTEKRKGKMSLVVRKPVFGVFDQVRLKPGCTVPNCKAGEKAVVECEKCPVGYHVQEPGLWRNCVKCPKGKTSLEDNPNKCVPICPAGKTWNFKKKNIKNCKTPKTCCKICPANTFKANSGNHACTECPRFWKPNSKFTACNKLVCPAGYEPRTLPDETKTCAPCKFGHYKGSKMKTCNRCPNGRWTLTTGATALKECIAVISDPACNAAFPTLVKALEEYAYDMTVNDTLGDVLCEKSLEICELRSAILACINLDTPEKQLLPVYNDYEKTINLTTIITHDPWCVDIYWPGSSSSSSYSSFSSSSHSSGVYGWAWMFGGSLSGTTEGPEEGSGVPMENLRMGEPGDDAAWWNGAEDSATIVPIPYSSAAHTSSSVTRMPVGPQCFHYKYAMKIEPMAGGTGGVKSGSGDPVAVGSFDP